jgi:hypothetical protein
LFLQEDLVCGDDYVSITDFFRSDYGGNVGHEPDFLLSFRPFGRPPNSTSSGLGFRVARTIP